MVGPTPDAPPSPEREKLPGPDSRTLPPEMEGVLDELPEGMGKVTLYRKNPATGPSYLDTWMPDGFSLERVKAKYGGGEYLVKLHDPESGQISKVAPFSIEGEAKRPDAADDNAPDDVTADKMGLMYNLLDSRLSELQQAGGMGGGMTEVLAAMIQQQGQLLQTLMQSNLQGSDGPELEDLVSLVRMGVDLGREGGGFREAMISRLGEKVIEKMGTEDRKRLPSLGGGTAMGGAADGGTAMGGADGGGTAMGGAADNPPRETADAARAASEDPDEAVSALRQVLQQQVPEIDTMREMGADPRKVAHQALDHTPQDVREFFRAAVDHLGGFGEFRERFFTWFPDLEDREWWEAHMEEFCGQLGLIEPEGPNEPDS